MSSFTKRPFSLDVFVKLPASKKSLQFIKAKATRLWSFFSPDKTWPRKFCILALQRILLIKHLLHSYIEMPMHISLKIVMANSCLKDVFV